VQWPDGRRAYATNFVNVSPDFAFSHGPGKDFGRWVVFISAGRDARRDVRDPDFDEFADVDGGLDEHSAAKRYFTNDRCAAGAFGGPIYRAVKQ